MRRFSATLCVACVLSIVGWLGHGLAQDGGPRSGYAGVVPGSGHAPPRPPSDARHTVLTWPGFQLRPDGASRFFVQTTGPVTTDRRVEEGRFVLLLKDSRLHLRNNRRPLETQHFNTPVSRAWVERRGDDLAFVLALRAEVTPRVTEERGPTGYHYVFVEFPSGDFLPAGAPPSEAGAANGIVR